MCFFSVSPLKVSQHKPVAQRRHAVIQCCYIWMHVNSFTWMVESARAYIHSGGYSKLRPTHSIRYFFPLPIYPHKQQIKNNFLKSLNEMIFDEGSEGFLWNCPPDEECEWSCWCLWHHRRCGVHSAERLWSPIFLMNAGAFGWNARNGYFYCSNHLSGLPHCDGNRWGVISLKLKELRRWIRSIFIITQQMGSCNRQPAAQPWRLFKICF